jgi:type IV pilus assembly protein PilQ
MNLDVTPQVANNGNVILDVNVQREFLGAIVDEATGAAPVHNREAKTKVMVKNGQTAVIGGIYQNDASNNESGVPFLKDIPIIGFFFRSDNYRKDKTELLLFLTPRILSQIGSTQVSGKELSNVGVE